MAEYQYDILLIEDEASLATIYTAQLNNAGITVRVCSTAEEALSDLGQHRYALVLLDLGLPDGDGIELLAEIRRLGIGAPVIVVTGDSATDRVVEALRMGAQDYLVKPLTADRLVVTVSNALELSALKRRVAEESGRSGFEGFIGASRPMQAVYSAIENVAQSKATVFVTGESGTGKELCAEAIHSRGPRRAGPFVAINCGAIPKDLIESELFGHVKGAFTGAIADRKGAAIHADGGTLFLDEICEMDVELQTKLLRFLQTESLQRVGSQKTEHVDVRVICATNRNPLEEVNEGRFRADLYYRLNVIPIHMPPLRERGEDSVLIAEELLRRTSSEEGKQFSCFSAQVLEAILSYTWPGNVRELQNLIRRIVVLNQGPEVGFDMLPEPLVTGSPVAQSVASMASDGLGEKVAGAGMNGTESEDSASDGWVPEGKSLAELERKIIEIAIQRCGGNVFETAKVLQVSPSTLYRKRAAWAAQS